MRDWPSRPSAAITRLRRPREIGLFVLAPVAGVLGFFFADSTRGWSAWIAPAAAGLVVFAIESIAGSTRSAALGSGLLTFVGAWAVLCALLVLALLAWAVSASAPTV